MRTIFGGFEPVAEVTLPPENVSLAESFNPSKENGNDEDSAGALHAGVQARGGTAGHARGKNCWDNACSETLFGSPKVEWLHGQGFVTRRQAKDEVIDWALWYNRTRLHSTLAYVSPMRFEKDWHAAQAKQANS